MENNKLEAWGDYVEEYATRQKQLHKELVDRKLMEMELENTMVEKIDLTNIQTNKITSKLNDNNTKAWLTTLGGATIIQTLIYVLASFQTAAMAFLYVVFFGLISFALWMIKEIVREKIFDNE